MAVATRAASPALHALRIASASRGKAKREPRAACRKEIMDPVYEPCSGSELASGRADLLPSPTRKTAGKQRRKPKQERSRATVDAILDAAARILRRHGPKGLTTAAIAARAGVSVGSIYDYFPTKDAIVIALAKALLDDDVRAIQHALAQPSSDPIRLVVRTLIIRHRADRAYRRKVMSAHIGAGLAGEHAETVQAAISLILERLPEIEAPAPLAVFVASHSVLGVCRALVDERAGLELDAADLETALLSIVDAALRGPS